MNIHQVSVRYLPEQDRVLMRINTRQGEELQVWFTRRLALNLWPTLQRSVAQAAERATAKLEDPARDPAAQRILGSFHREAALQRADFTTRYESPPQAVHPLGAEPLLVTEMRLAVLPAGALRLTLREKLPGQAERAAQVDLVGSLVDGFEALMGRALKASQWNPSMGPREEPDAPATPARYLN